MAKGEGARVGPAISGQGVVAVEDDDTLGSKRREQRDQAGASGCWEVVADDDGEACGGFAFAFSFAFACRRRDRYGPLATAAAQRGERNEQQRQ